MRCSLDSTPVLPQGNSYCIDAIHDTFIVSGGTVWVQFGKALCLNDSLNYFLAREILPSHMLDRDAKRCHSQALSAQVGENSNCDTALAKNLHNEWRSLLGDCVYDVGTHAIAHIHE